MFNFQSKFWTRKPTTAGDKAKTPTASNHPKSRLF